MYQVSESDFWRPNRKGYLVFSIPKDIPIVSDSNIVEPHYWKMIDLVFPSGQNKIDRDNEVFML